jgi:hypothetical protein
MIDVDSVLLDKNRFLIAKKNGTFVKAIQINHPKGFFIMTKEGRFYGNSGDYLIIDINGERHLCDRNVFELNYDIVE